MRIMLIGAAALSAVADAVVAVTGAQQRDLQCASEAKAAAGRR